MTDPSPSLPGLRPFLPDDAGALAELCLASIEELAAEDYSEAQQEAWAESIVADGFGERLARSLTLVATVEGAPVGFIALRDNRHVDLFFVHPRAAGQGVGAMLYDAVERLARARGGVLLTVDVSDNARGFFERRGFTALRRNTVTVGDEWLGNTTMEKPLAAPDAGGGSP
ncbi:MAG: GNAT family N-acetyltransferase [Microvirga sp.]